MTKKIIALTDYITSEEAAKLLSSRYNRMIGTRYVRKLALRKKDPIRCIEMGNRWLYLREDVERVVVRESRKKGSRCA